MASAILRAFHTGNRPSSTRFQIPGSRYFSSTASPRYSRPESVDTPIARLNSAIAPSSMVGAPSPAISRSRIAHGTVVSTSSPGCRSTHSTASSSLSISAWLMVAWRSRAASITRASRLSGLVIGVCCHGIQPSRGHRHRGLAQGRSVSLCETLSKSIFPSDSRAPACRWGVVVLEARRWRSSHLNHRVLPVAEEGAQQPSRTPGSREATATARPAYPHRCLSARDHPRPAGRRQSADYCAGVSEGLADSVGGLRIGLEVSSICWVMPSRLMLPTP